jgi:hypothetical protein
MNLIGLAELAELYGVSKNTANTWARRHDWPSPVTNLKMGPVWDRDVVLAHKPLAIGKAEINISLQCWWCGKPLVKLSPDRQYGQCDSDCMETTLTIEMKNGQVQFLTGPLF